MAWGGEIQNNDEPLWCLVDDNYNEARVALMAETKVARQERRDGKAPSDRKETLVELDGEVSRFINKNRRDCRHTELLKLISVVSIEAAKLEASKPQEAKTTSSVL